MKLQKTILACIIFSLVISSTPFIHVPKANALSSGSSPSEALNEARNKAKSLISNVVEPITGRMGVLNKKQIEAIIKKGNTGTSGQIQSLVKQYGIYVAIAFGIGAVATYCGGAPNPGTTQVLGTGVSSPVGDPCQSVRQTVDKGADESKNLVKEILEYVAKYALNVIKQRILAMLTDQIVTWIQGGGSPKFVTNWRDFMQDAENQAIGDVIRGAIPQLCSPFSAQVGVVLKTPGILLPVQKFGPASCTLDQVVENIQGFYKDFRSGGWVAYQTSWQPQNNFYGSLLLTIDAANIEASAQAEAAKNEANSSNGFLSEKRCDVTISTDTESEAIVNQSESQIQQLRQNLETGATLAVRNCQIITPGSFVGDIASKAVGSKVDAWIQADDIGPYLDTILNAAINKLTEEGTKGLLGLAANENELGTWPTSEDLDSVTNDFEIPDIAIQGGICTTEDNPETPATDEGGEQGIFIAETDNSGQPILTCISTTPSETGTVLTPTSIQHRKDAINTYRELLQHLEWSLLLKMKTKQHLDSILVIARTLQSIFEGEGEPICRDGTDTDEGSGDADFGTYFDFKNLINKYRYINSKITLDTSHMSSIDSEDVQTYINALENDILQLPSLIEEVRNRLNVLQAPAGERTTKLFLHSVYSTVARPEGQPGLVGTFSTIFDEPLDPIITPFYTYGTITLPDGTIIGHEIGTPAIIETIASQISTGGPTQATGALHGSPENAINIPLPLSIRPLSASNNSAAINAMNTGNMNTSDEAVYGITTLSDAQIDALYKSFVKFSLEHFDLVSVYANKSHPAYQYDLKKEEYRARELHHWLFSRNLYNAGEYFESYNDGLEYLTILGKSLETINIKPSSETGAGGTAAHSYFSRVNGGGLIGMQTVDIQEQNAQIGFEDNGKIRLLNGSAYGTENPNTPGIDYATIPSITGEQVDINKIGLFTWCTGYPVYNPELF